MTTSDQQAGGVIRPFTVQVPKDALDDLQRRLAATRWPTGEMVESRFNALPQFATEIDGVSIH